MRSSEKIWQSQSMQLPQSETIILVAIEIDSTKISLEKPIYFLGHSDDK